MIVRPATDISMHGSGNDDALEMLACRGGKGKT